LTPQISAQTVFARLLHAHGSLMRAIEARMLAQHGLSANDFETLLHLSRAEHGAMRRIDLAEGLRLTPSGVTRLLDGLEVAGLTDRSSCSTDARVTYAVITDAGRDLLALAACSHAAACEELIGSYLSPAELDELAGLLGRLPGVDAVDATACSGGTSATG
jgi:MarR family transcriptional regulator, 2-MHQ and catechol-resistance regulon repressor